MNVLTPQLVSAFFLGLQTKFNQAFRDTKTRYDAITTTIESTTEAEIQAWMSRQLKMRKWEGSRLLNDMASRAQELVNDPYEASFKVPRRKIADDKLGIFQPMMEELARVAKHWPDRLVWDTLKAGATSLGYDGQYQYDTDHPINMDDPSLGTQSNRFTATGLSSDNLATVVATMGAWKGEDGQELEIEPNLLVVGPDNRKQARRILNAEIIATTAGTAAESNVLKGDMDLLVVPRLASIPGVWFVMDTTRPIKPMLFQLREAPTFDYLINSTDPDVFMKDEYKCGVKSRGASGYGPWWLSSMCTP
jgi:phage major head subunit gpT-like protein